MKKIVSLALAFLMTALLLAGCGTPGGTSAPVQAPKSVDEIKTIGDVMAIGDEFEQWAAYEGLVVYAFELDGVYYRAITEVDKSVTDAIFNLDYSDEKHDEKQNAILAPLEVGKIENLSEQMLTREQMDAWVGKTGQELQDEGWSSGNGYNLETMEFWMYYGPFCYTVVFDGKVPESQYESFDEEEDIKKMTVKSVEFNSIGDATNVEMEED